MATSKATRTKNGNPPPPGAAVGRPSSISDFREAAAGTLVTLPSGKSVQIRRPGMPEFMRMGFIPDALSVDVDKMIKRGQGVKPADEKAMLAKLQTKVGDPEFMADLGRSFDKIVVAAWVSPPVAMAEELIGDEWHTIPAERRALDRFVYTDEIDFEDKSFTFNYAVGGTADVARFRQEASATMDAVRGSKNVEVST